MILYLIRHGKSLANTAKLVTGTPDDVLSDIGVIQAQSLAKWLKEAGITATHYITTPWKRAQQTAEILWPEVEWSIDSRIGEADAGQVANWPLQKFLQEYPSFFERHSNRFPEGESHQDLYNRAIDWLYTLSKACAPEDRVVLVAHSGPISCILQHALGIGVDRFPALPPAYASLSILDFPPPHMDIPARVLAFSTGPAERLTEEKPPPHPSLLYRRQFIGPSE